MIEKKQNIYSIEISKSYEPVLGECFKARILFEANIDGNRNTMEKKMFRPTISEILTDGMIYFKNLPE